MIISHTAELSMNIFYNMEACLAIEYDVFFSYLVPVSPRRHISMQCQLIEIGIVWGLSRTVIIEPLGHCKGGNFNIHIWAWFGYFICPRRAIRIYLFGK